ncbi:hypothetical protein V9L05_08620 [Bernardetia sp. Wsw4-3y2]|uniref:peptidoglycan-binding domain-containing protein n=1 Tax=Bernardetia sp. Wsw4-3y2 TaxID=3127471 RepID=UPI0030D25C89
MAKKKKTKQDKTLSKIGVGFGVAGGLLLTWYGINRYQIWLDNRKMLDGATTAITGGNGNNTGIPVSQNVICKGDKKPEVRILQSYLKFVKGQDLGAYGVDGDWGTSTQKAVDNVFSNKPICFNQAAVDTFRIAYQGM